MNRIEGIHPMHVSLKTLVAASLALAMAACGNVSQQVAKDGGSAGELVWPSPGSATPMHKGMATRKTMIEATTSWPKKRSGGKPPRPSRAGEVWLVMRVAPVDARDRMRRGRGAWSGGRKGGGSA